MSAVLTLIFIALMAWFAFDGYRNGFYYGLVRLTTLLLVFLIAEPIGSTFSSAFENWELIPPVIRPYLGALVVGVVMVALGTVISHIVKKHTMKVSEEPTKEELKELLQSLHSLALSNDLAGAAARVVEQLGEFLAEPLPVADDDIDELSNVPHLH